MNWFTTVESAFCSARVIYPMPGTCVKLGADWPEPGIFIAADSTLNMGAAGALFCA